MSAVRKKSRRTTRLVATGPLGTLHSAFDDDERRASDDEQLKLAGFRVGTGVYAIDIMRIKEVIQAGPYPLRSVPHAPAIVEGVIALRGVVIPVIDLRKRFGAQVTSTDTRFNKLIIVSVRGRIVGLKVDRILGELRIPSKALRPAPSMLRPSEDEQSEFFAGVCRVNGDMVFVVNLETLLDPRISSRERPPSVAEFDGEPGATREPESSGPPMKTEVAE